ncbi:MAG TPA: deoxyribose-phosphate aldolase [Stellaceae bacterium]|nr:deoxyribose-phosphate aldolase [Stellaceae bacterium]
MIETASGPVTPIRRPADLAPFIDHTILRADARAAEVERFCLEARQHGFRTVCVNPWFVPLVARLLAGGPVLACSVVGFPLGATATEAKVAETAYAVREGAREIDMVITIGALKDGQFDHVRDDIRAVKRASGEALLKVIIETSLLDEDEKVTACRLAQEAGADFVKTSTGFSGGATAADVALMRRTVGPDMGVKASGGIRTFEQAAAMIAAGATRIGASASLVLIGA